MGPYSFSWIPYCASNSEANGYGYDFGLPSQTRSIVILSLDRVSYAINFLLRYSLRPQIGVLLVFILSQIF
jgi:hypothetical protein